MALAAAVGLGLVMAGLAVVGAALLAHAISAAFLSGADAASLGGVLAALALVLLARAYRSSRGSMALSVGPSRPPSPVRAQLAAGGEANSDTSGIRSAETRLRNT